MVRSIVKDYRILSRGYTLIEFLVVIGIIGIIAAMTTVGFGGSKKNEILKSASSQLIDELRLAQNMATNGALGENVVELRFSGSGDPTSYDIVVGSWTKTIKLPAGLFYNAETCYPGGGCFKNEISVCFSNPNATATSCGECAGLGPGKQYGCEGVYTGNSPFPARKILPALRVCFAFFPRPGNCGPGTSYKIVMIEGQGLVVTRFYEI